MQKNIILKILFFTFLLIKINYAQNSTQMNQTIYQFSIEDINGDSFNFSNLKGKKIMIVNTASKCGLTPQYEKLQKLYEKYKDDNFVIIGFPANNFLSQEPGTNNEIEAFCKKNYGVTFPMMSKISVKGKDIHPIFNFLTKKELNGYKDSFVMWNFQKYLINSAGSLEKIVSPWTTPFDDKILSWIEEK